MILLVDTTGVHNGKEIIKELQKADKNQIYELVDTSEMNISHCVGCNCCWLKTPGICVIKDDYEQIRVKMIKAEQIWLIADTKYGFISCQAKNVIDRVMPMVTMYLKFKKGQMRISCISQHILQRKVRLHIKRLAAYMQRKSTRSWRKKNHAMCSLNMFLTKMTVGREQGGKHDD